MLTVHRGSLQIGGSCVELRSESGSRILLDLGMPLTRPDGSDWPRHTVSRPVSELRYEGVLPDIDGLYPGSTPSFDALVLSHAHMDHYGLTHYIHPDIPVYASPGTIELLRLSKLFLPDASIPEKIVELPEDQLELGGMLLKGIPVDHPAPDSRALLIEADSRRILYSGDLRAHGRRPELFWSLPDRAGGVDLLILEGTTIGQPAGSHGFRSEKEVEQEFTALLGKSPGLVLVIASGQNLDRAISLYNAALATGRELVLDSYQAYIHEDLSDLFPEAPRLGMPGVRVKFVHNQVESMNRAGLKTHTWEMSRAGKVSKEQMAQDPGRFVYLARSSGTTAALLQRLPMDPKPAVVWSQWSGYLKKPSAFLKYCQENGLEITPIHSGGHAYPEDLVELVQRLKPRVVVPIHTEAASQYSEMMPNVLLLQDGVPVDIDAMIR
jgi:ribonuclease J